MPEFDKLDSYIDEAGLIRDTDFFLAQFKKIEDGAAATASKLQTSLGNLTGSNVGVKATVDGLKDLSLTTANYTKVLASVAIEVDNFTDAQKATLKQINEQYKAEEILRSGAKETVKLIQTEISQAAKKEASLSNLAKTIAENRAEQNALNRELKLSAAVNETERNSLGRAQALILQYTDAKKKLNLSTEEGRRLNENYNKAIEKSNAFILANADAETKRTKNVGNYAAATNASAKIIVDALEKERSALKELQSQRAKIQDQELKNKPAINSGTTVSLSSSNSVTTTSAIDKGIDEATKKIEILQKVVEKPQFLKLAGDLGDATAEIKFFTKALIDLERSGEGNSEAAKQLRNNLAELTDQVADAKAEVQALSSDTRGFDLFAGSVEFAADAFQTFAGAAVLAGASEEDAAEATKTLVAVQSIANGVKGIANELTTRGTAANKLFAFAQLQVKTALDVTATSAARLRAAFITLGIGALIVGIGLLIANFQKIKDALGGVSDAQKLNNEVGKKAVENYGEQVSKLSILIDTVKKGGLSFDQKKKAVSDYNEEFGKTLGSVKTYAELERKLIASGGDYIKYLEIKASAEAAYQLALESKKRALIASQTTAQENTNLLDVVVDFDIFETNGGKEFIKKGEKRRSEEVKKEEDKANKLLQIQQDLLSQQEALRTKLNIVEDVKVESPKKAAAEKKSNDEALKRSIDAEKAKEAALLAIAIANASEKIRVAQSVIDNENALLEDQNKAIATIYNERVKIESLTSAAAIASEKQVQDGKIVEVKKGTQVINKELNDFNIKYGILNQEAANQRLEVEKKQTEKLKLEYEKQKLAKIAAIENDITVTRDSLEKQFNETNIALNNLFISGKISQDQFNAEKLKADLAYQQVSLQNEIAYQKQLIAVSELTPDEKATALKELSNLEKKLSDLSVENFKSNEEKKREEFLKTLAIIQEKADVVFGIVGSIIDASSIRQKNKLAEEKNEIEIKTAAEIAAVEASGENEEKKAARIAVINARALSQKEAIARKEKQIELDKARFDKAQTVFRLTLSLAEAIASLNVFKIVAATIQLGVAIATPIPRFAKGLHQDYEGPAVVGDGGRKEVIKRKDGSIEITPDSDTLTYINKGDRIHPDADMFMQDMQHAAMRDVVRAGRGEAITEKQHAFDMAAALDSTANKIVTAIKNKPENHLSAKDGALVSLWKHGAGTVKYFEENTNW